MADRTWLDRERDAVLERWLRSDPEQRAELLLEWVRLGALEGEPEPPRNETDTEAAAPASVPPSRES